MRRLSLALLLTGALLCSPYRLTAHDEIELRVSPSVSFAPANVNVRARVEKDADNRGIEISAESGHFFRSSFVALDGDKAPSVTELAFKELPGGVYQVNVVLIGSQGVRGIASSKVTIIPSAVDR